MRKRRFKSIIEIEYFAGDCMKVIGEMCVQLSERSKLQKAEILAVVAVDLAARKHPSYQPKGRRPTPTSKYLKTYHSGNELVVSKVIIEKSTGNCFAVIVAMCDQMAIFDNISDLQAVALVKSYLDVHIIEVDV